MPRGRKSIWLNVHLTYPCEWKGCTSTFADENLLKYHQLEHFKVLCDELSVGTESIACGICNASFSLADPDAIERHSHFHAWTAGLRAKGRQMQLRKAWPTCYLDPTSCNLVPELPTKFECGWEYCDFKTNDVAIFIRHVMKHPEEYNDTRYPRGTALKCLWENCSYVANRLRNLSAHLDTHTQMKRTACPTCGLLLVDFRKFEDHLKRQQIHLLKSDRQLHPSIKPVKCPRCRRLFSTQRILEYHMKRHINTVKCPFCEMTTMSKSALERHLIFRHSNSRPIPCPFCQACFKMNSLLNRHLRLIHKHGQPTTNPDSTDLDDQSASPNYSAHIHGPLAQHGAIFPTKTSKPLLKTSPSVSHWLYCPHPGCGFKTTKRNGYLIHVGRKHIVLRSNHFDGASLPNDSPNDPVTVSDVGQSNTINVNSDKNEQYTCSNMRLYACHMCSVVKRRGSELSKHLIKAHQLSRPSGHVRFTYTISDDGHYRLQRTRLDSIPVATALLGESIVKKFLSNSDSNTINTTNIADNSSSIQGYFALCS